MSCNAPIEDGTLPGLLRLPNELLFEIASSLSIQDLRSLAKVNHKFSSFASSYLTRYHYTAGILKLPDELLLKIAQDLGTQANRSHFARASLRFYPTVMNYVVRYDVRHNESSLLMYTAKCNLKGMARKILRLGGDVNTENSSERGFMCWPMNPLSSAAYHGHKRMVRLFLQAGAIQVLGGDRVPLNLAIGKGHEHIAVLLSQDLRADDTTRPDGDTLLNIACEAKMVSYVKFLLERGYRARTATEIVQDHSSLLQRLIAEDGGTGKFVKRGFVKRELHEEVYQIAMMLLQHKADPDMLQGSRWVPCWDLYWGLCQHSYGGSCWISRSPRQLAYRHPDPRVRTLLLRAEAVPAAEHKASSLQTGQSLPQQTADNPDGVTVSPAPVDESHYATLWDFQNSESFPSLGQPVPTSRGTGGSRRSVQQTTPGVKGKSGSKSGNGPSKPKKKQWVPFAL